MRVPLLVLIASFSISIIGLVMIPGQDDLGKPFHLGFFNAFYILSITATTLGYGEVPYAFTNDQRLWMALSIYLSIIAWLYAIGTIFSLFQDAALKQAIKLEKFKHGVKVLHEPFFIICGYGETGSILVRALDKNELRVVVIEISEERVRTLEMTDYQFFIPHLCADAKLAEVLLSAGLQNPMCQGVAAITDDDHANLAISVAIKLIKPHLPVLARAQSEVVAANMASFGTDHIINPYHIFGEHLAMRANALGAYLLHEWLTNAPGDVIVAPTAIPDGDWIVCGYGRFGKAVVNGLKSEQFKLRLIESDPVGTQCQDCIVGSGVEAQILQEAGVEHAVGIVAGTDDDINNLSIVMTACELNPRLFVIIRKNKRHNEPLFQQFNADISMQPSDIIAQTCLSYMISPMLADFLEIARQKSNAWANSVIAKLVSQLGEQVPDTWDLTLSPLMASAVCQLLLDGQAVELRHLLMNPGQGDNDLPIIPLLLVRHNNKLVLPDINTPLFIGDKLLFCGLDHVKSTQRYLINDTKTFHYLVTQQEIPNTWVGRLLMSYTSKKPL
ncbi:MAG: NAD-binding protein [Methylophilaceae bacterium]